MTIENEFGEINITESEFEQLSHLSKEDFEKRVSSQWERITITNDFVFCKVMQDESLLSELIRVILPDVRFSKLVLRSQETIDVGMDVHGVRFDIFVTDEDGTAVEIEMQVLNTGNLPRRIRFYGSLADTQMLEKGVLYSKLKDSYVIMICPFDAYGFGLHRYTFTNRCKEVPTLEMGDGTTKIVLNASGTADDVSGRLKEFLDYVAGKPSDDDYIRKLDDAVKKARQNKEWRREYMTLMMRDLENQERGVEIGTERGIKLGYNRRDKEKIASMLRRGKTAEDIADFCDYPIALVREVEESLLVAQ